MMNEVEVWDVQYRQNGDTWVSLGTFWKREDAFERHNRERRNDSRVVLLVLDEADAEQICE